MVLRSRRRIGRNVCILFVGWSGARDAIVMVSSLKGTRWDSVGRGSTTFSSAQFRVTE
jgi:hypothetical protein